jgi:ankyrin repeat protein
MEDIKNTIKITILGNIRNGNLEGMKKLLNDGLNPNDMIDNTSLLHHATLKKNGNIAKLLIEKGANVNAVSRDGDNPLNGAILSGNIEIVELLIKAGANVNAVNATSVNGYTPLYRAISEENNNIAKLLIEKGANVNVASANGYTPLHRAISEGNNNIAKLLIEKGANVNVASANGYTPLHRAILSGNIEMVKLLIKAGANVDVMDKNGNTPLRVASWGQNTDIAKLLIEKKANVNAVNRDGDNPLNGAILSGNIEMVKLLIKAGADVNTEYQEHGGIVSYAKNHGAGNEIIQLLERARKTQEARNQDQNRHKDISTKTNKLSPFSKFKLIVLIILPFLPLIITGLAGLMIGLSHVEKINQSLGFMKEIQSFTNRLSDTQIVISVAVVATASIAMFCVLFAISRTIINYKENFKDFKENLRDNKNLKYIEQIIGLTRDDEDSLKSVRDGLYNINDEGENITSTFFQDILQKCESMGIKKDDNPLKKLSDKSTPDEIKAAFEKLGEVINKKNDHDLSTTEKVAKTLFIGKSFYSNKEVEV